MKINHTLKKNLTQLEAVSLNMMPLLLFIINLIISFAKESLER